MKLHPALYNVLLVLLVALPAGIVIGWIAVMVSPPEWIDVADGFSVPRLLAGFAFWYAVLFIPGALGALAHQIVLRVLPPFASRTITRVAILLTAPIVVLVMLLLGRSGGRTLTPALLACLALPMVAYGMLAKPLRAGEAPRATGLV